MKLTADDARRSLNAHAAEKGLELRQKYGPEIGWNELLRILEDRSCVRYPCEIVFDLQELRPGEMAHPVAKTQRPEDGFTIHVHPHFQADLGNVPGIALYQLVTINYGPFASAEDAESFGACALGLSKDEYYHALCAMADEVQDR